MATPTPPRMVDTDEEAAMLLFQEPLVGVRLPGFTPFECADADILQEVLQRTDDFQKVIPPANIGLGNLRAHGAGNGLFTSSDSEEIWQIAHRILLPAFGVQAIRQYYDRMVEVANELLTHLDTLPQPILVTDWMTRMTFEAIGYAGFSTRFHCMDTPEPPPFVAAMVTSLTEAMHAANHGGDSPARLQAEALMRQHVDALIQERKEAMERGDALPDDLLQIMLTTKDRVTNKMLPESNIRCQLITFLIAGHETTSGLLSYAIYHLMRNPECEQRLIEEVDHVLGRDYSYKPTFDDLEALPYTLRVLKEALRLDPTAPGFGKTALKDTTVGKYAIPKGTTIRFFLPMLHRNPRYWSDPLRFDPDRFLPEAVSKRHPEAYHPFGAGIRSCIGFQFALKEATMVLARCYQRYRFRFSDPNYTLQHVHTLTVKPKDLYVNIEKRPEQKGALPAPKAPKQEPLAVAPADANGPPLLFLYGSNMGTCQGIAQQFAHHAQAKGYRPIVRDLDSQVDKPWECPTVAIITSTYNGTPPDNAAGFAKWISALQGTPFSALKYTVLGVGNTQWHATFQRFPKLVDERMAALGAMRLYDLGAADMDSDPDHTIETWAKGAWQAIQKLLPPPRVTSDEPLVALTYACEVVNFAGGQPHAIPTTLLDAHALAMPVTCNNELLSSSANRSTRHIELQLPSGASYRAGDHMGILPQNPPAVVERAAALCRVRPTDVVVIKALVPSVETLPVGIPIPVRELLTSYVDLLGPVGRKELRLLAAQCPCPPERKAIEALAGDGFAAEIAAKQRTLLDICEQFRSVPCSLDLLLSARPVLKPRYYSISSSPLALPDRCSLTVGVSGVCSDYLARSTPPSSIQCFVKDTMSHFRLPDDPTKDLILIGPGTGLAPLRGFLQERAQQRQRGTQIGRQILFFGCRSPDQDYIYREELEGYQRDGLLQGLYVAFSRMPDKPKCYVQDLLLQNAPQVWDYLQKGAHVLVCGDAKHMAPAVRDAFRTIAAKEGKMGDEFLPRMQADYRYVEDVWASSL